MSTVTPFSSSIHSNSITIPFNFKNPPQKSSLFTLKPLKTQSFPLKITNSLTPTNPKPSISQLGTNPDENSSNSPILPFSFRLRKLVSEFRSLPEPIDRVRRLLDYAAVLPGLGESTRSSENRVPGCAAQVWLEVEVDELGRIWFGADSDSEITKGFCSCLIFLLNGAYPHDILKVKAEDLADMNVGLPVRSRVNSWHNVLINMQERTKNFAARRPETSHFVDNQDLEALPSLVISDANNLSKDEIFVP